MGHTRHTLSLLLLPSTIDTSSRTLRQGDTLSAGRGSPGNMGHTRHTLSLLLLPSTIDTSSRTLRQGDTLSAARGTWGTHATHSLFYCSPPPLILPPGPYGKEIHYRRPGEAREHGAHTPYTLSSTTPLHH